MKIIVYYLTLIPVITSLSAEEWSMNAGKKPSNNPSVKTTKISEKLDFIAYKTSIDGEPQLSVRIRNGKHKMGDASITIALENSSIKVQRIDINRPIAALAKEGNGEHLFDTFTSSGKSYDIFYNVQNRNVDPKIIIRSK